MRSTRIVCSRETPPTNSPMLSATPSTSLMSFSSLVRRPSVPSPRSRRPLTLSRFLSALSRLSLARFTFSTIWRTSPGFCSAPASDLPTSSRTSLRRHADVFQDALDLRTALLGDSLDVDENAADRLAVFPHRLVQRLGDLRQVLERLLDVVASLVGSDARGERLGHLLHVARDVGELAHELVGRGRLVDDQDPVAILELSPAFRSGSDAEVVLAEQARRDFRHRSVLVEGHFGIDPDVDARPIAFEPHAVDGTHRDAGDAHLGMLGDPRGVLHQDVDDVALSPAPGLVHEAEDEKAGDDHRDGKGADFDRGRGFRKGFHGLRTPARKSRQRGEGRGTRASEVPTLGRITLPPLGARHGALAQIGPMDRLRPALRLSALLASVLVSCAGASPVAPSGATAAPRKPSSPRDPHDRYTWQAWTRSPQPLADEPDEASPCGASDRALRRVAERIVAREVAGKPPLDTAELTFALRSEGAPYVWPRAWTLVGAFDDATERSKVDEWLRSAGDEGVSRCAVATVRTRDGAPGTCGRRGQRAC